MTATPQNRTPAASAATDPSDAEAEADRLYDEWEAGQIARQPTGYQYLRLITSVALLTEQMLQNWLRHHDDVCRCGACRDMGCIGDTKYELNGLAVLMAMSAGVIQGYIPCGRPKFNGVTYGDDLRDLAALSDVIDAREDAEADDMTLVVTAEGGAQ